MGSEMCIRDSYYGKFMLLDAQFANDHLRQFGLMEISKNAFQKQLQAALAKPAEIPLEIAEDIIFNHLAQARIVTS